MAVAHAHHDFDPEEEERPQMSGTDQSGTPSERSATVTEMHKLDKKITKEKAARKVSHAELKAQISSLEATTAAGFKEVHAKMDAGFKEVDAGFKEVEAGFKEMNARFTEVDAGFKEHRGEVAEAMAQAVRTMVLAHVAIAIVTLAAVAGIVATIVNLAMG